MLYTSMKTHLFLVRNRLCNAFWGLPRRCPLVANFWRNLCQRFWLKGSNVKIWPVFMWVGASQRLWDKKNAAKHENAMCASCTSPKQSRYTPWSYADQRPVGLLLQNCPVCAPGPSCYPRRFPCCREWAKPC